MKHGKPVCAVKESISIALSLEKLISLLSTGYALATTICTFEMIAGRINALDAGEELHMEQLLINSILNCMLLRNCIKHA